MKKKYFYISIIILVVFTVLTYLMLNNIQQREAKNVQTNTVSNDDIKEKNKVTNNEEDEEKEEEKNKKTIEEKENDKILDEEKEDVTTKDEENNKKTQYDDEYNGVVVVAGAKINLIDKNNNTKTLYSGEDIRYLTYHNDEMVFLDICDKDINLYSINLNKEEVKELTNKTIRDCKYNSDNESYIFYDENYDLICEIKTEDVNRRDKNNYIDVISRNKLEDSNKEIEYNDWVYYTDDSDGSKIYRKSKDEQVIEKLNNENSSIFTIINDYILYENDQTGELVKLKVDGSSRMILASSDLFYKALDDYVKNGNYYKGMGDYYKDIVPYYNLHFILDDNLYFNVVFRDGGSETMSVFCKTKIDDEKNVEVLGELGASSFITKGDWIYYQGIENFFIRRMNMNSGIIEIIYEGDNRCRCGSYDIVGDTIIYSFISKIGRMNLDGSEKTILFNTDPEKNSNYWFWFIR
ncbi:MAG: DUF5050 domain-containing protein [Eubacteriales bacterium]